MTLEMGMQGAKGRLGRGVISTLAALCACAIWATAAQALPPQITTTTVSSVTSSSAIFEADINPQGKSTNYHFEYGPADCASSPCTSIPFPEANLPGGSSPVRVKVAVEGLTLGTIYHYRAVAQSLDGKATSTDHIFATRSGAPSAGLPDNRAYEQASPIGKDGGDAVGRVPFVKATPDGSGITFGSTFGIPGGKGAQALPTFLASRGGGEAGWSTRGLLPPVSVGERAQVRGWLPDFSEVFSSATFLGTPRTSTFVADPTTGGLPTTIAPHTAEAEYSYAGTSQDRSVVFFESRSKLLGAAVEGGPNVYAWERSSGELTLAGVLNDGTAPPKGTIAGSYDWMLNTNAAINLREGGAERSYYLEGEHAISADGDVYFTAAGTAQLYLRQNPTQPQSPLDGDGQCTDPALACTVHVSASQKTNGESADGTDPAGPQPAAFQAASADGSKVYFTSPEKLTNNANTGPEQPVATISLGGIGGGLEVEEFIPEHAVGVAVDGAHVYWADPATGTIGRADLDGTDADPLFISPGPVEFETEPGVIESVPSKPRYVAVDAGHIYWTNTGRTNEVGEAINGGGTIGRAELDGNLPSVEPDFIRGASNPQGIAVNAAHIYWANPGKNTISRAAIGGGGVEPIFFETSGAWVPRGVALSPTHVYLGVSEEGNNNGYLLRVTLAGGEEKAIGIGKAGVRGVAVDGAHVYWATQGEEAIGRANLELEEASVENKFIPFEGKPNGLAADAAHLYWATNGEAPTNPGNDLYRYEPATETLTDLTVDASPNGADVQGVVAATADGSYLYFTANGDLDGAGGPATAGNCQGPASSLSGSCSLYLRHEGTTGFVARLRGISDAANWVATPQEVFGAGSFVPKSSFLSEDGRTLLFRSQEKLSEYDNEGTPQLYLYRVGEAIRCVSCNPGGEAGGTGPSLGSIKFPSSQPPSSIFAAASRNLSADGNRVFFETAEALSPQDTNGQAGCPLSGFPAQNFPACLDVYEWEAAGAGSCSEASAAFNPINGGCIYLISTGKDKFPSLFADASKDGNDVFFFTRQQLVGQDKDGLQDVYDARVGGGLASQNATAALPCESTESCHDPAPAPPAESSPATPTFVGPGNPVPKHKKQKAKKHKSKKHKKHKKHNRANAKGRTGR